MFKKFILSIFAFLILGIIYLASDIKDAYKVIPISSNPTMEVPAFADWRSFNAPSERFKVDLPAPPQYAKQAVPIPGTDTNRSYEMYVSEKLDGSIFMISLITYPEGLNMDPAQLLHDSVDEMITTKPGNKLTSIHDSMFQNHRSVDFRIDNPKFIVAGKAFLVERTVYLLTYVASRSNFTIGEYDHFIDSFDLLSKKQG